MPGLSVACGDAAEGEDAARALGATEHFDHYVARTSLATDRVLVGETEYEGYPLRRIDTEHGTAFLEGCLYDVEDVDAHLERVASLVAADDVAGLREWVGARDGDFLLLVTDGEDVTLCTDAFGRLPAYYTTIDGTVVCSRELAYVREFARLRERPLSLDRLTVGQYLCFGYPLGTRTTFEDVRAVPPGSLVRLHGGVDGDPSDVQIESVYEHDFEDCPHADRSVEANARELADRIETACQRRSSPDRPTVVSLSGGLDSRTVAGAYATGETPAQAASFQYADGRNDDEVATAGVVARHLDLDWTVFGVEETPANRRTLLQTKQGMNYLGMAFVLDFFEQLRERHGTTTCVTGDGGDKLLVGLEPSRRLDSEAALVEHAIDVNGRMAIEEAAAIANVEPGALRASVADRIASYPETDLARRYVHFLVRERGVNFLVQGEDRNRYYAWSVSPFYDPSVFEYAMGCPDEQKAYRRLQRAILAQFDPDLVGLHYPNYGAPVTSTRYRAKQFVYDALERYPGIRERVVDLVTADSADHGAAVETIRADLPQLERVGLSRTDAAGVLATPGTYSPIQLQSLATIAALAREVATDRDGREEPADAAGAVPGAASVTDPDDAITVDDQRTRVER